MANRLRKMLFNKMFKKTLATKSVASEGLPLRVSPLAKRYASGSQNMKAVVTLLILVLLQGCNEGEPVSKVVHSTQYSTIGLGPKEHSDQIVKELQNSGVPVVVGTPDEMGITQISWPTDYDEVANSVIKQSPKLLIPNDGGILNVGYCKKEDITIQSWQTNTDLWLIKVKQDILSSELISSDSQDIVFSSLFEIPEVLQVCLNLEQKFTLVLPLPADTGEANHRLSKMKIDGKINNKDKYYYWLK